MFGCASLNPDPWNETGFVQAGVGGAEIKQPIKWESWIYFLLLAAPRSSQRLPTTLSLFPHSHKSGPSYAFTPRSGLHQWTDGRLVDSRSVRKCWGRGSCVMLHTLITVWPSFSLWCRCLCQQPKTASNYLLHIYSQTWGDDFGITQQETNSHLSGRYTVSTSILVSNFFEIWKMINWWL